MKTFERSEKAESNDRSFLDITREKYYNALSEAKPLFAWFSLTDACNLNCKYCFIDATHCTLDSKCNVNDQLNTKDVYSIIDNIYEAGTEMVMFAGGEPTLREDLIDIVKYSASRMNVAMNTNGYLLDEKLCLNLAKAGLSQVKVSVDGLEGNHDWNRGSGSYRESMKAISNFNRAGVAKIMLIMTLSKCNYDELDEMVALSMELGVDFTMVEFLPLGKASNETDCALSKDQIEPAKKRLVEAQKRYGWQRIAFENRYIVAEDETCKRICTDPNMGCGFYDFCVGCISGIYSYCITASGTVVAGDIMDIEVGDLRKARLKDLWENAEIFKTIRNRENLKGKCGKCQYKYVCGGCRRRAYTYTGDIMAGDPGCWHVSKK